MITIPFFKLAAKAFSETSTARNYLEELEVEFTRILGTAREASLVLNGIRDLAIKTPLRFQDFIPQARALALQGLSATQILAKLEPLA